MILNKPTIPTIPAKNVIYNTHTNGQVAKFDTTTGTITASGYTIAKSVPSSAIFTDTNYYHTPAYTSGLSIGTGSGIDNLYVPIMTAASSSAAGAVGLVP